MTREEAIRELKQFSGTTRLRLSANFWEALDMAIKALEQESCEGAISRRAVLNTLDKMDSVLDEDRTLETYKELLVACYNDLPSVTPTRKKGKWIRVGHDKVKCSECEVVHFIAQYPHGAINYCPNCGTKMEGEDL